MKCGYSYAQDITCEKPPSLAMVPFINYGVWGERVVRKLDEETENFGVVGWGEPIF